MAAINRKLSPLLRPGQQRKIGDARLIRAEALRNGLWRRLLAGWGAAACVLAVVVTFGARPDRMLAMEATVQMEQFVSTLSGMTTIAPDTTAVIGKIIQRPEYDCAQVNCGAALAERNRSVRARLETLLQGAQVLARRQ